MTNGHPLPILGLPLEGAGNWPKDLGDLGEMTSIVGNRSDYLCAPVSATVPGPLLADRVSKEGPS